MKLMDISKSFSGVKALQNISMEIYPGTIYSLVGENGCGKSTLIKIISGVYSADSGSIELDGRQIKTMSPIETMRNGIEIIYQDFSIFPNLTVAENIAVNTAITENKKIVNWTKVKKQASEALTRIGVDIPLDAIVESLSVASRQLIAISRAIAHNARVLIMDEPTTALTKKEVDALFEVIRGLNRTGISVIFVSHKLDEVMRLSQRIVILRNGEKVAEGDISSFTKEQLIFCMTGRNIAANDHGTMRPKSGDTVLSLCEISQKGGFSEITFDLKKGEIIGITGLLGSGRTALVNAIFGIHPITSGSIFIEGKNVIFKNVRCAIRNGIAYVPEDRLTEGLFLEQSVSRNIIITVLDKLTRRTGSIDACLARELSLKWIEKLHIKTATERQSVKTLSGGNQQKVVIAKWLARKPKVLLLNGPTVGVDIGAKTDIIELILALASDGMSIILASDDVSEIMMCCDRIMIMSNGRITKEVNSGDITEQELNEMIRGREA